MFSYVTLGDLRHFGNNASMGQNAGCLGRAYDPFTVPFVRPMNGTLDLGNVTSVLTEVDPRDLEGRRRLREEIGRIAPTLDSAPATQSLDGFARRAFELLSSS